MKDLVVSKEPTNTSELFSNQNLEGKNFKKWLVGENKNRYEKKPVRVVPPIFKPLPDNDKLDSIDQGPETFYKYGTADINFVKDY